MISIIICSVNPKLLTQLKINIEETIGVPYQVIAIDNKDTGRGICEVYNTAVQKVAFPVVCFCHEDIKFITADWGAVLLRHFSSDDKIGLIGVAGGDTKGLVPSGWFTTFGRKYVNISQEKSGESWNNIHEGSSDGSVLTPLKQEVLTIDGLFMCTKKEIIRELRFDQDLLKGFHGYDTDFSLQIYKKYKVVVVYDLLISHLSKGNLNRDWLLSTQKVTAKWKKELPLSVLPLTSGELNYFHWKSLQVFLEHMVKLNYSSAQIVRYYLKYTFSKYFNFRRSISMAKFLIYSLRHRGDIGTSFKQSNAPLI